MIYLRRVYGNSMLPTLKQGNIVLAVKKKRVKVNDLIIAKVNKKEVVKRVKSITNDGSLYLLGDNLSQSTDSRTYGNVGKQNIIGVVLAKI